eukprot:m.132366 g.132366  ORF g.132366 m.132366 type:complete len:79 (+) comp52382_c0_seq2:41-277(+)
MLSDLILFGTLLVNAGAVLNFKLGEKQLPVEFALPTAEETSSTPSQLGLGVVAFFSPFSAFFPSQFLLCSLFSENSVS